MVRLAHQSYQPWVADEHEVGGRNQKGMGYPLPLQGRGSQSSATQQSARRTRVGWPSFLHSAMVALAALALSPGLSSSSPTSPPSLPSTLSTPPPSPGRPRQPLPALERATTLSHIMVEGGRRRPHSILAETISNSRAGPTATTAESISKIGAGVTGTLEPEAQETMALESAVASRGAEPAAPDGLGRLRGCGRVHADSTEGAERVPGGASRVLQETGAESSEEGSPFAHPVCWRSTDEAGYAAGVPGAGPSVGMPGVAVFGTGCSDCVAGATCSFSITVMPPAVWTAPESLSQKRELNVVIEGPALHAGLLAPMALDDSSFLVTYTIWDAGTYSVSLSSSCGTLKLSAADRNPVYSKFAAWRLRVHPLAAQPPPEVLQQTPAVQPWAALTSPCAGGTFGRWLTAEDGKYRWTTFPCAPSGEVPSDRWISALNKKGVREINFIGDSHQRMLVMHLRHALSSEVDVRHKTIHTDFSYTVHGVVDGEQLQLNFYWMAGIYNSNDIYGCSKIGRSFIGVEPPWPLVSRTADVWVLEAGYWTGQYCGYPDAALSAYLPRFLHWASESIINVTREVGKRPLFLYRSTPPRPTEDEHLGGCRTRLTNKYVRAANSIEHTLIPHFGALLFNSWEIEAPRFRDNCPKDHHFSCVGSWMGKHVMEGSVGEADVKALVHFILSN